MTRDEAVKTWLAFGTTRIEADLRRILPQHVVNRAIAENAEDCIDGLIALGLLHVEAPRPGGDVGSGK